MTEAKSIDFSLHTKEHRRFTPMRRWPYTVDKAKAAERSRRAKLWAKGIIIPEIDLSLHKSGHPAILTPEERAQLNSECKEAKQECCMESKEELPGNQSEGPPSCK